MTPRQRYTKRNACQAEPALVVWTNGETGSSDRPVGLKPNHGGSLMSWQAALSFGIPALVAVGGVFLGYRNNLRLSERKDRLDRVSRQLSEFYGPLFATVSAGSAAWELFLSQWKPSGTFWDEPGPTPDEAAAWRRWMTTVFMPLNRRARDLIVDHADLLDDERIPQCS